MVRTLAMTLAGFAGVFVLFLAQPAEARVFYDTETLEQLRGVSRVQNVKPIGIRRLDINRRYNFYIFREDLKNHPTLTGETRRERPVAREVTRIYVPSTTPTRTPVQRGVRDRTPVTLKLSEALKARQYNRRTLQLLEMLGYPMR